MTSDFCSEHSATCQALDGMQKLQEDLRKSGGVLDAIYKKVDNKVPWLTFTLLVTLFSSIVGVTFVQLHSAIKEQGAQIVCLQTSVASMQTILNRIDRVVNHKAYVP